MRSYRQGTKRNRQKGEAAGDGQASTGPLKATEVISTLITVNYISEERQNGHNIRCYKTELRAERRSREEEE